MRAAAVALLVLLALALPAPGVAQMPDVRQMSGIPMPTADVPAGTVVVRVVRGEISNNIPNHPVELHIGEQVLKATTDQDGRATFANIAPGSHAHAVTVVDGERLESGHIEVTASGGIRVMLAGGAGGAPPPAAPGAAPVAGTVTLGGQSRIQIEFDDAQLEVFYLFEIVNRGAAPVATGELAIDLPPDAQTPSMLEGSSTQAQVRGKRIVITGPFQPGSTPVQVAYGLDGAVAERTLTQPLPVAWDQVQVIVSKVGDVQIASDQFTSNRAMPNEGHDFLLGTGPALAPGTPLTVRFTGLPSRSHTGRWLTLALGVLVLLGGAWAAFGSGAAARAADGRRTELEGRQQRLMADLLRLDQQHAAGVGDPARYQARRQELMAQLERVYGELDQRAAPAGAGE